MKKILMAVLALVVLLVALVLAHPLWIGPVVRTAVSRLAPKFLGVPAHLDGFSLNAYSGRVTIDGFALDNPPGCSEAKFVTVGHLCVDVDPMTVLSDVVVVEEISLKDLYVSLMTDDRRTYNFKTIAEHASPPGDGKEQDRPVEPKVEKENKPGPKVVIDLLQVQNALVQWERVPLPLPSFRLTGIGRSSGGMKFDAAWTEIETRFVESLGPLAKGLQSMLTGANDSLGKGMKAVSDVTKKLDTVTKRLDTVAKSFDAASAAAGDTTKKSVDATKKALEGTVDSLKSLFK